MTRHNEIKLNPPEGWVEFIKVHYQIKHNHNNHFVGFFLYEKLFTTNCVHIYVSNPTAVQI